MAGRQAGFWDVEDRLRELPAQGDPLEKLAATVDFEVFRAGLAAALGRRNPAKGGRPGFDAVLKFRMLTLQAMHGLSGADRIPAAITAERDAVLRARSGRRGPGRQYAVGLSRGADRRRGAGAADHLAMSGQILDATLVAAPRQRNAEAEKAGKRADEIWPEKPAKARQKDVEARWTVKFAKGRPAADGRKQIDIAIPTFGYKSHVSIDRRHGIIRRGLVTDAFGPSSNRWRSALTPQRGAPA